MCCVFVVYVFESCSSSAALEVACVDLGASNEIENNCLVRYGVVQSREKQNWFLPYM